MEKPAIQSIIEEGLASGITNFTIIANTEKQAIKKYFSLDLHLENLLHQSHKEQATQTINNLIDSAQFTYVPQPEPLGLGHAVLMAEATITQDYCSIFLPDEIMTSTIPAMQQLISVAHKYNASVIAVQEVPRNMVSSYGIVAIKQSLEKDVFEIDHLIEKPSLENAPSQLAIIGRYVLSSDIFSALKQIEPGANNEIQLTDGIALLMQQSKRILACKVDAIRHDIGNPLGWLQANIFYGLRHPLYGQAIKDYIHHLPKAEK
jgi:UTP--glucose-1-phosphate uridylyltransferase